MKDELSMANGDGWAVAGILIELDAALLTTSVGDGGLAGVIEMAEPLLVAANDARFGAIQPEGETG